MARSKDAWLRAGAGDLQEAEVQDVPAKGESVKVRGLPAAYSNQAQSEALETTVVGREQVARVNKGRMEELQFLHGVVDPVFTLEEVQQIAKTFGPAFNRVIEKIDELSGLDKEAITKTEERFPVGGEGESGANGSDAAPAGSGGPTVPTRIGG